jgi:hypothetical protein
MTRPDRPDFLTMQLLHSQLTKYGLNPCDWIIRPMKLKAPAQGLEMRHRHDTDFRFQAQLERTSSGRTYLRNLTLTSI